MIEINRPITFVSNGPIKRIPADCMDEEQQIYFLTHHDQEPDNVIVFRLPNEIDLKTFF